MFIMEANYLLYIWYLTTNVVQNNILTAEDTSVDMKQCQKEVARAQLQLRIQSPGHASLKHKPVICFNTALFYQLT